MAAEAILAELLRLNVVASVAILVTLLLRPSVLRSLGARVVYWLWLVVPVAVATSVLPARERVVVAAPSVIVLPTKEVAAYDAGSPPAPVRSPAAAAAVSSIALPALAEVLVVLWLLGAALLFSRSIATTRRLAADPSVGPALVGVWKPKLVLPADFAARFDAQERALILAHEAVHRASGHTVVNGLVEVARCASWFNPLVHFAVQRLRADQELACDAAVIAARPAERRAYAQALLKSQLSPAFLRFGCTWTSSSARRIGERIALLARPPLGHRTAFAGASTVAVIALALGYAAWAQQPERVVTQAVRPSAVWTKAADAPEGVLAHALEGQRHDLFIELAQKGDIDLVFFGTTETEMWSWAARGRAVWEREFAGRKGVNFGSQGTHAKSLLWRMRNGELDGYEAQLVVLQLAFRDRALTRSSAEESEFLEAWSAVIAEIRLRQPRAKILLNAAVPRGAAASNRRVESWREIAAANAAVVEQLTDGETVFYADFGERFFLPDGSYNPDYWDWGYWGGRAGIEPAAYEVWAEELKPWIERFIG